MSEPAMITGDRSDQFRARLSVAFTEVQMEALVERADAEQVSVGKLVRRAVDRMLAGDGPTTEGPWDARGADFGGR